MSGYLIAQLNVKNPFEPYKNYIETVTPLVKKFGGRIYC